MAQAATQITLPSSNHMPSKNNRALKIAAGVAGLFFVLIATILHLLGSGIITPQMAMLMFVALLGLYFGFGVLIAAYRFVSRLQ